MRLARFFATVAITNIPYAAICAPVAKVVFHTAFYKSGEPRWEDAPISDSPRAGTLSALPATDGKFVMIGLDCARLGPDGKLRNCRISAEPNDGNLQKVGARIAADLRIDPVFSRSKSSKIKFISIQIRASNSAVPATNGPCWPPTCQFVPAPPPPPPR